jgi:CRP-like cAMP-binding protein
MKAFNPTAAWRAETSGPAAEVRGGSIVFDEGERVLNVLLLESGVVSVHARIRASPVFFGFRGTGRWFGVVAALLGGRHTASAIALSDCRVKTIPVAEFHRLRTEDVSFGLWLQEMLTREEQYQLRRLETWAAGSCEARLDQVIVELVALAGIEMGDGSMRLGIPLLVQKLSDFAGMQRETASRHFSKRIKAGTLNKHNGWFVIPRASDLMDAIRAERTLVRHNASAIVGDRRSRTAQPLLL